MDLTKLNEYVQRENHPLPSVDLTLGKLAGAKYMYFTKLDANSGFWQIKLSESSRPLTTFITPWGRYCFNVLPYGISSGSEKFQKCMSRILEGLEGVECNIDDVLVHAPIRELHNDRLEKSFEEIKSILTAAPVLALYDPNKETKISADESSFGLGGVPLQKQDDQTWRPVMFISRALTPAECRYAQIEKEALALTWACEQFSDYIVGKSIIAENRP